RVGECTKMSLRGCSGLRGAAHGDEALAARRSRIGRIERFLDEIEEPMIEGIAGRSGALHESFALAFAREHAGAVMTIGIVAGSPEERGGGEAATAHAHGSEVTLPAVTP